MRHIYDETKHEMKHETKRSMVTTCVTTCFLSLAFCVFMLQTTAVSASGKGMLKCFDNAKGFGFIVAAESKDIFVHFEDIKMQGFAQLSSNQQVEYSVRKSDKGLKAFDVVPIVEEDA